MSAPLVLKFSHLVKMPEPEKALGLLEKIASLVKPIMKKHSWTLPLLSEFFPSNSGLLGMNKNGGEQILIRLRPSHSPDRFLELDDLIGTMLHELTHNVHGPHDEKFYAFLKTLNEEYDGLISGGYTGEGFLSNGTRVGVGVAHDLPPHLAKAKALAAAEERAKKQRLMGPGGKIGGVRVAGKTPRELAADAAERRMRDDKTCGSSGAGGAAAAGRKEQEDEEVRKAARDGVVDVALPEKPRPQQPIDLDLDDDDDLPLPTRPKPSSSSVSSTPNASSSSSKPKPIPKPQPTPSSSSSSIPLKRPPPTATTSSTPSSLALPSKPAPPPPPPPPPPPADQWSCPTCTFHNSLLLPTCEICSTNRPLAPSPEGTWDCERCGRRGNEEGFWSCRGCGGIKLRS